MLGTLFECKLSWLLCSFSIHNIAKGLVILSIKVYVSIVLFQIRHDHSLLKHLHCCLIFNSG